MKQFCKSNVQKFAKVSNNDEVILPVLNTQELTKCSNNNEVVLPMSNTQGSAKVCNTIHTRKYEYITYEQALRNFTQFPECNKNMGRFLNQEDSKTTQFINKVQERIKKQVTNSVIDKIKLRGRKARSFTAWILLKDNKGELKINESLLKDLCDQGEIKVTAITLLMSAEEKRGIRISLGDNKERLYEILNGEYCIIFYWEVEGKACEITMNIKDDGKIDCTNMSQGLTNEDIERNSSVKVKIGEEQITLIKLYNMANDQRLKQANLASGVSIEQCKEKVLAK